MAHIVTLKDNNDEISYPITPVDAVFVDSNTTLADALDDKADADFSNVASGAITGTKIASNTVTASNIDWTTLTVLSGSTNNIELTAGKWLVVATANILLSTSVTGSFDANISWLGQTQLFQGYRPSGQNRNQSSLTFTAVLTPAATTTYTCTRSGGSSAVDIYNTYWTAIKLS